MWLKLARELKVVELSHFHMSPPFHKPATTKSVADKQGYTDTPLAEKPC